MMRRSSFGIALLCCSATAAAQSASIHGTVWDSVAARPLAGATVQLVGEGPPAVRHSSRSDSVGRFAFDSLPAGRYTVGFLHAKLDSLGLEPPLRSVDVGDGPADVRLAIPSARRIRDAVCGTRAATGGGVVVGFVRDARDASPVEGAIVRGDWLEYTLEKDAVTRRQPMVLDTTNANGWFALCGVPGRGLVGLRTSRSDSAGSVEVEMPASGLARRDVFVGGTNAPKYRLSGRVVAGATRQPLADVQVRAAGAAIARTDADGNWALDAPAGTRMLDIRALGYYPVRQSIDVVPDAPAMRTELFTMKAMLDTIRVTASRLTANMQEFEQRHRSSGSGAFLTHDMIRRLNPATSAAILRNVPGMEVFGGSVRGSILMKGAFYDANTADLCKPDLFVDGMYVPSADDTLRAIDIDALTAPEDIAGIEVYREPFVPAQFRHDRGNLQTSIGACGAIVVWRMPPAMPEFRDSRKRRVLKAAALAGTAVALFIGIQHAVR